MASRPLMVGEVSMHWKIFSELRWARPGSYNLMDCSGGKLA